MNSSNESVTEPASGQASTSTNPSTPTTPTAEAVPAWKLQLDSESKYIQQGVNQDVHEQARQNSSYLDIPGDISTGVEEGLLNYGVSIADLGNKVGTLFGMDDHHLGDSTFDNTKTKTGSLASGITEFVTAMVPFEAGLGAIAKASKVRKATALLKDGEKLAETAPKLAELAKLSTTEKRLIALGSGAAADFTGFTGQQGRLSNLVEEHVPSLSNPLTRYLASDPSDHWAEARFKQAVEGAGLGLVTDLVFTSVKAAFKGSAKEGGKEAIEEAVKAVQENARGRWLIDKATSISANITTEQAEKTMLFSVLQAKEAGKTVDEYLKGLKDIVETDGRLPGDALSQPQPLDLGPNIVKGDPVGRPNPRAPEVPASRKGPYATGPEPITPGPKPVDSSIPLESPPIEEVTHKGATDLVPVEPRATAKPQGPDAIPMESPKTSPDALPVEKPQYSVKDANGLPSPDALPLAGGPSPLDLKDVPVEVRGFLRLLPNMEAIMYLHKSADVSTFFHEMFHYGRLLGGFKPANLASLAEALGVKEGAWDRSADEKAASLFERYLFDGTSPHPGLDAAFKDVSGWMKTIYKTANHPQIAAEVSPQVRGVFNQMLGFGSGTIDRMAGMAENSSARTLAQAANKEPWQMTSREFYKAYQFQHTLLRDAGDAASIEAGGFKQGVGPNAALITQGPPDNAIAKRYGTRAGQKTYAIPKSAIVETGNGPQVKGGHKPTPAESVIPARDHEPFHEAIVREAVAAGKAVPEDVLREYPHLSKSLTQKSFEVPANLKSDLKDAFSGSGDVITDAKTALQTHVNYSRLDLPDNGKKLLETTQRIMDDRIFNRRDGVVPNEVTAALATELAERHGLDADTAAKFISRLDVRTDDLAKKLLAGRILTTTFVDEASRLNLLALNTPFNKGLQQQADEAIENLSKVLTLTNNTQTEVARALQSYNITSGAIPFGERELANIVKATKGNLGPIEKRLLRRALAAQNDVRGMASVLKRFDSLVENGSSKTMSVLNEWFINSLLGKVTTQVTNLTSQAVQTMLLPIQRMVGGALTGDHAAMNSGWRAGLNLVQSALDVFQYTNEGLRFNPDSSVGNAVRAFLKEQPILDAATKMDAHQHAIQASASLRANHPLLAGSIDWLGKAVRLPTRTLTGADEFFKQVNYRSWLRDEAFQDAIDRGLSADPNAFAQHVERYMADGFDAAGRAKSETALLKARQATFTQDLLEGTLTKSLSDVAARHPLTRQVVPFIKVPTNLLKTARDYTPGVNFMFKEFRDQFFNADSMVAADARGRAATGGAFWTAAVGLAATGGITGGGPKDPQQRANLMNTGWRPYSFAIAQADGSTKYVEYKRMEPLAMIVGLAADFSEISAHLNEQETSDVATAMTAAVAKNLLSKTYVTSLAEVTEVMSNPEPNIGKFIKNRVGTYAVPGMATNFTGPAGDNNLREVRTYMDAVMQRIPGYSDKLPPKRDLFGEPINTPNGYAFDTFRYSTRVGDKVKEELAKLEFGFGLPPKKYQGIDLTLVTNKDGRQAYDFYTEQQGQVKIGGKTLPEALSQTIDSPSYKKLPDPEGPDDAYNGKVKAVQEVIGRYREAAAREMLKAFPEVMQLRNQLLQRRRDSQRPASDVLQRLNGGYGSSFGSQRFPIEAAGRENSSEITPPGNVMAVRG